VKGPREFDDGSERADTVVRIDFTVDEKRSMWSAKADMVDLYVQDGIPGQCT
jgi:hypothetical protein